MDKIENLKEHKRKKTKLLLFLSFFAIIFIFIGIYSTAQPWKGDSHGACHPGTAITISSTSSADINVELSETFDITITATGTNLEAIVFFPSAEENTEFTFAPNVNVTDDDTNDDDADADEMSVTFTITAPSESKIYVIQFVAMDNQGTPIIAILEFNVNVGNAAPDIDLSIFFDHIGLWLGLPALILLSFGTFFVLKNESKYVKLHGIFAGAALILTIINVISLIKIPLDGWSAYPVLSHWPHMILGGVGLVAGFMSMLYGIAAERKNAKITGYITLICWWAAFILGILYLS